MRVYYILIGSLLMLGLYSCSSTLKQEEVIVSDQLGNYLAASRTFYLENDSRGQGSFQYFTLDDVEYLMMVEGRVFGVSGVPLHLDIYDFDSGKRIKRITVEEEGPNGIPQARNAFVVNFDSILVTNVKGLFTINDQGQILHALDFSLSNAIKVQSSVGIPPIKQDGKIWYPFYNSLLENHLWVPENRFFITSTQAKSDESSFFAFGFPEIYKEFNDDPSYNFWYSAQADEQLFISFGLSDSVYTIDQGLLKPAFFLGPLDEHKFSYSPVVREGNSISVTSNLFSAAFRELTFDPYHRQFIRIFKHSLKDRLNGLRFSLLIADAEGKMRAEITYHNLEYNLRPAFSHPLGQAFLRPRESDDYIIFDFFDLSGLTR